LVAEGLRVLPAVVPARVLLAGFLGGQEPRHSRSADWTRTLGHRPARLCLGNLAVRDRALCAALDAIAFVFHVESPFLHEVCAAPQRDVQTIAICPGWIRGQGSENVPCGCRRRCRYGLSHAGQPALGPDREPERLSLPGNGDIIPHLSSERKRAHRCPYAHSFP